MSGASIAIDDASATDTILSVKKCVFSINRKLPVYRQRLVYSAGPRGMDALADDETLGGAGVAQDGSAKLDVLLADLTKADLEELGSKVFCYVELNLLVNESTIDFQIVAPRMPDTC
jgi:hypothetical protein